MSLFWGIVISITMLAAFALFYSANLYVQSIHIEYSLYRSAGDSRLQSLTTYFWQCNYEAMVLGINNIENGTWC